MSKDIEQKFRAAGIDTASVRLNQVAIAALQKARGNPIRALNSFRATVLSDVLLLAKLVGPDIIRQHAEQYLAARVPDPKTKTGDEASMQSSESQDLDVRPSPTSQNSSRPSHALGESQWISDRPAAPVHTMVRSGVMKVAKMSVLDKHISGSFDVTYRHFTPRVFQNLVVKNRYTQAVENLWRPIMDRAPSLDTPVPEFATEKEIEAIDRECDAARDAALNAVKQVTYGK